MPDQISIKELLQDPVFKAWMRKLPKLKTTPTTSAPWLLYVRMGSKWSRKEYDTYPQAFNAMVKLMRHRAADDAAIHSKRQEFRPPIVRRGERRYYWPSPSGHRWCGYCRRPTVFRCFKKHHAMKMVLPYEPRCSICGARQAFVRSFHTTLRSRFG